MKGHATIELTDITTGDRRVIQEDNMVTDAVARLFSDNINGMALLDYSTLVPLGNKCMKGLLLFEKEIPEDPHIIYAPSDNTCIGYASNDVNTTTDTKRGSYNANESAVTDDGYRWVWDFNTSQGNGIISSLALTFPAAGIGYMYNGTSGFVRRRYRDFVFSSGGSTAVNASAASVKPFNYMVSASIDNNLFTSIYVGTNGIQITDYSYPWQAVGLKSSFSPSDAKESASNYIYIDNFFEAGWKWAEFDGNNEYFYIFGSNTAVTRNIRWVKVNKLTYSHEHGELELDNSLSFADVYATPYSNSSGVSYRQFSCAYRNGYLYLCSTDKTGLYKVKITDSVDISFIEFGFTGRYLEYRGIVSTGSSTNTVADMRSRIIQFEDYIIGGNFIVSTVDDSVKSANIPADEGLNHVTRFIPTGGTYMLSVGYYEFYSAVSVGSSVNAIRLGLWHGPYIATINNLAEPIMKTATQTMKITYTLSESQGASEERGGTNE